jgi:hypothetical protein
MRFSELQAAGLEIARTAGLDSKARTALLAPMQDGSALPFAPNSSAPYGAVADGKPSAAQRKVAKAVAHAFGKNGAALSGDECRAIFGARLSGPARRKVLRDAGLADASTIARSYDAYLDGNDRKGSQHAREHGAEAVARREEAAAKAAKAEAAKARREARKAAKAEAAAASAE